MILQSTGKEEIARNSIKEETGKDFGKKKTKAAENRTRWKGTF